MKKFLRYWFLRMDYGFHCVDAYLWTLRGNMPEAANSENLAHRVEQQLDWLKLQP